MSRSSDDESSREAQHMNRNFVLVMLGKQMAEVESEMDSDKTGERRRDDLGIQFWTIKRSLAELGFSSREIIDALDAAHVALDAGSKNTPVVNLEAEYLEGVRAKSAQTIN
jgi:hypothetical protein